MESPSYTGSHSPEQTESRLGYNETANGASGGLDPISDDNEESVEQGVVVTDAAALPETKKKKKRKKAKSAGKRGLGKPTGMEEFFADAPLTPLEYEEQKSLYDLNIPILDRLLTAIQRFERTRKLTNERRDVFYKWLHYGGIKIAPNVGTGGQNLEELDNDQTAVALSQASISDDLRQDLENKEKKAPSYAIDFMACMRGFLSRHAPSLYAFDKKEDVEMVTSTLERFLDYLMQHNVCPEHQELILSTRNFCREVTSEIWSCAEAQRWLPGDFNIACSTLFEGNYSRDYDGKTLWGDEDQGGFIGLSDEEASQVFGFAIAGTANQEVYDKYYQFTEGIASERGLEVVKVIEDQGFEIIDFENPTADCKDLYKHNADKYRPVGRVIAKPWKNPEAPPEDLTEEERQIASTKSEDTEAYTFFIEEIILQHLSIGQKIIATVRQLNCGVWFFDEFARILPKFDLWLVNDLVEDFKEPRWLKGAYVPGTPGSEAG